MQVRGYQRTSAIPSCDYRAERLAAGETDAMETTRRARRVSWPVVVVIAAALGYSWVASGLRAFTHPMAVAVSIPLVLAGIALIRSSRRLDAAAATGDAAPRRGTSVWVTLIVLLLAWELISFRLSPRADHPTLSSIADTAMSTHPGRFIMFVAWLASGYWLFKR
jgi:hypothetical protein